MRHVGPKPPTDADVAEATGYEVESRAHLRSSPLSTVERAVLRKADSSRLRVIIKATRSALAHETRVYSLIQGFPICAADLLGSGETRHGDPWMLLSEVSGFGVDEGDGCSAGLALEGLAEVHSRYLGQPGELAGVPRWDPSWLASEAEGTCDALSRLGVDGGLPVAGDLLAAYRDAIESAAEAVRPIGVTLVHGDFDPGNLVRLSGDRVAALDWGLAHCSTPLVDLAHLVERFAEPARSRLSARYLELLGADVALSEDAAVAMGGLAHRAFFVWWHMRVIEEGWGPLPDYGDLIVRRVQQVASGV